MEMTADHGAAVASHSAGDTARLRRVLGHFPSGVTVVTTQDGQGPTGFTCQAFFSLSLRPALVAFAAAASSRTLERVRRNGSFAINVLRRDQEPIAQAFATKQAEKFSEIAWRAGRLSPLLEGALAWIECSLAEIHQGGDHALVVGRVVDLEAGEGEPLLFYRGDYGGFRSEPPIGETGVSQPSLG